MIIPIFIFSGLLYLVILLGFWSANENPPAKPNRVGKETFPTRRAGCVLQSSSNIHYAPSAKKPRSESEAYDCTKTYRKTAIRI